MKILVFKTKFKLLTYDYYMYILFIKRKSYLQNSNSSLYIVKFRFKIFQTKNLFKTCFLTKFDVASSASVVSLNRLNDTNLTLKHTKIN